MQIRCTKIAFITCSLVIAEPLCDKTKRAIGGRSNAGARRAKAGVHTEDGTLFIQRKNARVGGSGVSRHEAARELSTRTRTEDTICFIAMATMWRETSASRIALESVCDEDSTDGARIIQRDR